MRTGLDNTLSSWSCSAQHYTLLYVSFTCSYHLALSGIVAMATVRACAATCSKETPPAVGDYRSTLGAFVPGRDASEVSHFDEVTLKTDSSTPANSDGQYMKHDLE